MNTFSKTNEQTAIYVKRLLAEAFRIVSSIEEIRSKTPRRFADELATIYKFNTPTTDSAALKVIEYYLSEKHDVQITAIKQNVRYPYPNDPDVVKLIKENTKTKNLLHDVTKPKQKDNGK